MAGTQGEAFHKEVKEGKRFEFGKNWQRFLSVLDQDRVETAKASLKEMLGLENLDQKSFLDIGSGSGLFSLAARNLGATVFSMDYDPQSVACTRELKNRFFRDDPNWEIRQASVLDRDFMESLPKSDIIYSWGVLHHTGSMWEGLANAILPAKANGLVFVALYNDQGSKSRFWLRVKILYNRNLLGRIFVISLYFPVVFTLMFLYDLGSLKNPLKRFKQYKVKRGMSFIHDGIDWLGGLPFEVASSEKVVDFFFRRGFKLNKIRTTNSLGCNQFVFQAPAVH